MSDEEVVRDNMGKVLAPEEYEIVVKDGKVNVNVFDKQAWIDFSMFCASWRGRPWPKSMLVNWTPKN